MSEFAAVTILNSLHPISLLVDLLEDALSEEGYNARLAGLSYNLSNGTKGVTLSVGGFDNKLGVLFEMILRTLKGFEIKEERLKVIAEKVGMRSSSVFHTSLNRTKWQVGLGYENFYLGQPSNLAQEFGEWLMRPSAWTPEDKLAELPCKPYFNTAFALC